MYENNSYSIHSYLISCFTGKYFLLCLFLTITLSLEVFVRLQDKDNFTNLYLEQKDKIKGGELYWVKPSENQERKQINLSMVYQGVRFIHFISNLIIGLYIVKLLPNKSNKTYYLLWAHFAGLIYSNINVLTSMNEQMLGYFTKTHSILEVSFIFYFYDIYRNKHQFTGKIVVQLLILFYASMDFILSPIVPLFIINFLAISSDLILGIMHILIWRQGKIDTFLFIAGITHSISFINELDYFLRWAVIDWQNKYNFISKNIRTINYISQAISNIAFCSYSTYYLIKELSR